MDVVDQIEAEVVMVVVVVVVVEEGEVVEDPVVDHLVVENLSIHTMFVTNVAVNITSSLNLKNPLNLDRGHYAYDCEIRLRRQRRMK